MLGGLAYPTPGGKLSRITRTGVALDKLPTAAEAAKSLEDFETKTVGQITGSRALQTVERALARIPGGGVLIDKLKAQGDKLALMSDDIIANLAGTADVSTAGAGKMLEKELGEAGKRMRVDAGDMYKPVEELVPGHTPIGVKAYKAALEEITAVDPLAPNTSKLQVNPVFAQYKEALDKDLEASHLDALPYGTLKKIRTRLGNDIDWGPFGTDSLNGQKKKLYGALTADMNNGASAVSDEAAAAVKKANAEYAALKQQQEILTSVLNKAGGPGKIFDSLMRGTKIDDEALRTVLAQLDGPNRRILAASALRRMGLANPGAQDASGMLFSADSFMSNWNRMTKESKEALFGSLPGDYRQSVDQLVANTDALKAYGKILPNASNTAHVVMFTGELNAALFALMGHPQVAVGIGGSFLAAKALSSLMAHPRAAKWLARKTGQAVVQSTKGAAGFGEESPDFSELVQ
jgi:hypothetical protein